MGWRGTGPSGNPLSDERNLLTGVKLLEGFGTLLGCCCHFIKVLLVFIFQTVGCKVNIAAERMAHDTGNYALLGG